MRVKLLLVAVARLLSAPRQILSVAAGFLQMNSQLPEIFVNSVCQILHFIARHRIAVVGFTNACVNLFLQNGRAV